MRQRLGNIRNSRRLEVGYDPNGRPPGRIAKNRNTGFQVFYTLTEQQSFKRLQDSNTSPMGYAWNSDMD